VHGGFYFSVSLTAERNNVSFSADFSGKIENNFAVYVEL
jgi:hypothetical protein